MTDLLFLSDVSQVDALTAEARDVAAHARIVTSDMTTAGRLEDEGIPFIDLWDLLKAEDLHANWAEAWRLGGRWWEEMLGGGGPPDFSLSAVATTELCWPFEWCLNARLAYDRLLDSLPVRTIYGYFLPPTPVIQNGPRPWERSIASLCHAVLRWCAGRRGLPMRRLKFTRPLSREVLPKYHAPAPEADPGPPPAGCEPTLWVNLRPETPGRPEWVGDAAVRAPARPGVRTAVVMQLLATQEAVCLERLFTRTPGWRKVQVCHFGVPEAGVASWPWHERQALRPLLEARRAFNAARGRYTGVHAELFANPFLRFQFDRIWAELFKAARLGESFRTVLKTVGASLVIFGFDGFVVERMLARVAQSEGVPTASLMHGAIGHGLGAHDCTADADHMMVVGERDVQNLVQYGWPPERVRPVGSLRYGGVYQSAVRKEQDHRAPAQREARRRLGVPEDKPTVALLTATILGTSAIIARPSAHRETWREIAALAARRPDRTFIIKPHPGWDHYEFYEALCGRGPANLTFLRDATLADALAAADAAVLVNHCTTAGLEAMLHGVPVVFLRTAIYPREGTEDSLRDGGAISVQDVASLEAALDRLTGDDAFRRAALADAEPFLASFFGGGEGAAEDRILREWDRIALPPAAGLGAPAEPEIHHLLGRAASALAAEGGREAFAAAWEGVVGALRAGAASRATVRLALFRVSYDVGQVVNDYEELHNIIWRCHAAARGALPLPEREGWNMLVNASMVASIRLLRGGAGAWAAAFFRWYSQEAPRAIARLSGSPGLVGVMSSAFEAARMAEEARKAAARVAEEEARKAAALAQALGTDLEWAKSERDRAEGGAMSLRQQLSSLQEDLTGLRSSWTWKVGRLLVTPGSLLKRVIRERQGRTADRPAARP